MNSKLNKEILELAIRKAIKNGWTQFNSVTMLSQDDFEINGLRSYIVSDFSVSFNGGWDNTFECSIRDIIFSHDFAKAFWGEELVEVDNQGSEIPNWENELMQMVREKEPLKYLEKFL